MTAYSTRDVDGIPRDVPITLFGAGPLGSFGPPAADAKAVALMTMTAPASTPAKATAICERRFILILLLGVAGPFPRPRVRLRRPSARATRAVRRLGSRPAVSRGGGA